MVFADPLFEKVIYALIDNSLRHAKTLTRIHFTYQEVAEGLILLCEDDGVGIPAELKKKIFNREYFQNTGFGLYLSKEILSITNMSMEETGEPGKGARFEIHIPKGEYRFAKTAPEI